MDTQNTVGATRKRGCGERVKAVSVAASEFDATTGRSSPPSSDQRSSGDVGVATDPPRFRKKEIADITC